MPDPSAAVYVLEGRLRLSRAPAAELAAAALAARKTAGLTTGCDFIVVAVPSGTSPARTSAVAEAAARELPPADGG